MQEFEPLTFRSVDRDQTPTVKIKWLLTEVGVVPILFLELFSGFCVGGAVILCVVMLSLDSHSTFHKSRSITTAWSTYIAVGTDAWSQGFQILFCC